MTDHATTDQLTGTAEGRLLIRPLREDDYEALLAFGRALPKDDWLYLDVELQTQATIMRLVNAVEARNWRQVVALDGPAIVGYANVRQLPGWKKHVGDIVLVVRDDYRRHGVGTALARAVIGAARELPVCKLILEIVEEQLAGRLIFKRLGFRLEGLLEDQAVDYLGNARNLVLLSYHLPEAPGPPDTSIGSRP
jgi:ribosomal protein S18 acetylase RimI-like enzyme